MELKTIFSKIADGEIPCYKVAETSDYLAFLDVNPLAEGHTLTIPKKQIDYLFDLDDDLYKGLFLFSKKVARAVQAAIRCNRIGVAVVGLEVPHAHIHLIPINHVADLSFSRPRLKFTKEQFEKTAMKIQMAIN